MKTPLQRLYRTKLVLMATIATVLGVAVLLLAHWTEQQRGGEWVGTLPITDIGSALFTTGLIVIGFTYLDKRDAEERALQQLRTVLTEAAPNIRDAVVDGFAFAPDALTSVASTETLDRIVENCLGLQLGDHDLAHDVYNDLRTQVLKTPERWHDVTASVVLAPWSDAPKGVQSTFFVATIKWEFRVVPQSPVLRFSCVSDPQEYRDLLQDPTSTAAWYFEPVAGLTGASSEAFKLLQLSVDGAERPLRRTARSMSQTFTVNLGNSSASAGKEVTIAYTCRVLVQQRGHLIHFDLSRPTQGLKVDFFYGGCGIRFVNTLDYIAGSSPPRIQSLPASDAVPSVQVAYDGWVFPKGGVAFVWVLEEEMSTQRS